MQGVQLDTIQSPEKINQYIIYFHHMNHIYKHIFIILFYIY